MKTLDEILLEASNEIKKIYAPNQQSCEPKDNAANEARKIAKQRIEELMKRDMSQPYKPELEYKEK